MSGGPFFAKASKGSLRSEGGVGSRRGAEGGEAQSGEWGVGSGEWGVGSGEWGVGSGEWGKWRLCRIGAPAGWLGESCSGLQQSKGGRCEGRGRRVGRARGNRY
jgi:hypothetical protein